MAELENKVKIKVETEGLEQLKELKSLTTPKPGYKTSEFWLSTAAMLLGSLFASGVIETGSQWDQLAGLAATILGALGYTVVRGNAKKNNGQ